MQTKRHILQIWYWRNESGFGSYTRGYLVKLLLCFLLNTFQILCIVVIYSKPFYCGSPECLLLKMSFWVLNYARVVSFLFYIQLHWRQSGIFSTLISMSAKLYCLLYWSSPFFFFFFMTIMYICSMKLLFCFLCLLFFSTWQSGFPF